MKKRNLLAVLLLLVALLGACGGKEQPSAAPETSAPVETQPPETQAPSTEAPATDAPSTEAPTEPPVELEPSPLLKHKHWYDGVIVVDGVLYQTMETTMPDLIKAGWDFKLSDYGLTAKDCIDSHSFTIYQAELKNKAYDGPTIKVGLVNPEDEAKPFKECTVYSIDVSGVDIYDLWESDGKACYDFELPGNIHRGASLEQIRKTYGNPKSSYVNEGVYEKQTFSVGDVSMELTVFYDTGLQAVHLGDGRKWG